MLSFKGDDAEIYIEQLAISVNKKLKEHLTLSSELGIAQLQADYNKTEMLSEAFKPGLENYHDPLKRELSRIVCSNEYSKIHLASCISSFMALFEKEGVPKEISNLSPGEIFYRTYQACIKLDRQFYGYI